ncbi:hypothetical protein [Mycobacterium marinum]|uniref:hypothetical protein n=1 Tax=Mycobacterium marinum TaxID=1781 RepID=UPI000358B4A1|nr:hypothetical protein [Mycobacterium marinum]EPQ79095.1 putative secreted protein [Mycobacterium marinum MB2]MDC8975312.1 hypothetical protein [Mycobacterium marinum]MDC9006992.1 hypothetical protein [Mycobacterium marinum]QQW33429.1 hypothetical protein HXW97_06020 [Mycobacterium marinum]RFZ47776.1 hypothetical protein MSS2_05065 [Mycobacterium marinum]
MSIAKHERPNVGFPILKRPAMRMVLVGAAVIIGCLVGATPAGASPDEVIEEPNPFGGFSCNCGPAESPIMPEEITRGLRAGLT